jgi:hypothetical protein
MRLTAPSGSGRAFPTSFFTSFLRERCESLPLTLGTSFRHVYSVSTRLARDQCIETSLNNMASTIRGRGGTLQAHLTSNLDNILNADQFNDEDISAFVLESQNTLMVTAATVEHRKRVLRDYADTVFAHLSQSSNQPGALGTHETPTFPHSNETQIHYACLYLVIYARRPKDNYMIDSSFKRYTTLDRRNRTLFSALKLERPEGSELLNHAEYFKRTNQVLQKLSNEGEVTHEKRTKHNLGRDDCLHLIECDMIHVVKINRALETTLSHHLVWCFCLLTGVRPGSLVCTTEDVQRDAAPLTWGDIHITRDLDNTQNFTVTLTFRRLKGFTESAATRGHKLTHLLKSPSNVQYLALSLPHRLVARALQKGFLADHNSVDSVMSGTDYTLRTLPSCHDQYVFADIIPDKYNQINSYLQNACNRAGMPSGVTIYAFRRNFGTSMQRELGIETAQKAMDHTVGSSTYWKFYDRGLDHVDATNLIVDGGNGQATGGSTAIPLHLQRPIHPDQAYEEAQRRTAEQVNASLSGNMWQNAAPTQIRHAQRLITNLVTKEVLAEHADALTVDDIGVRKSTAGAAAPLGKLLQALRPFSRQHTSNAVVSQWLRILVELPSQMVAQPAAQSNALQPLLARSNAATVKSAKETIRRRRQKYILRNYGDMAPYMSGQLYDPGIESLMWYDDGFVEFGKPTTVSENMVDYVTYGETAVSSGMLEYMDSQ